MSPHDKGKILAYMEIFNATQIAKKRNAILLLYADLLTNTKRLEKSKIYQEQEGHLLLIMMKRMHLQMKL